MKRHDDQDNSYKREHLTGHDLQFTGIHGVGEVVRALHLDL